MRSSPARHTSDTGPQDQRTPALPSRSTRIERDHGADTAKTRAPANRGIPADSPLYLRTEPETSEVPRIFSVREAAAQGLSAWQAYDSPAFHRTMQGVRLAPHLADDIKHPGWADENWFRLRAQLASVRTRHPHVKGSHQTAAVLLGIPVPKRLLTDGQVHVLQPSIIRLGNVKCHRGAELGDPVTIGDVAVVSPVQALVQLTAVLSERELIIAAESVTGTWHPPTMSVEEIAQMLRSHGFFRGIRRLEDVLSRVRPGVASPKESELRLNMVSWGFPEPLVGHAVWIESIGRHLTPDLAYPEIRTGIEYEGLHHRTSRKQAETDEERRRAFQSAGWFIERIYDSQKFIHVGRKVLERFADLRAGSPLTP